jgi:serine/threonine protein kinase
MSQATTARVLPSLGGFQVHRELGHGGMGNVYLATPAGSARSAALKLIASSADGPEARARFAREIAAVSRVHHPNVVGLVGHGVDGGRPYALFDYVDGCDLGCVRSPLPWPVVVHLGRQLARAIAAVHEAGLIHRDIKPANVMVSRTCRLTLIDFGLAKLTADDEWNAVGTPAFDGGPGDVVTAPGSVAGTPRYLAPEVRGGEPASIGSDLYSFGLVLHQMSTGRTPSTETSVAEIDGGDAHRLLRGLVARCLEPDPAARLQRASAAVAILDSLDAQPGVIVRACMAGAASTRSLAVATTRFVGVGTADAMASTGVVTPLVARVGPLPDRYTRGSTSPVRHRLPAAPRSPRGGVAPSPRWSVEPTWFPTLAYPKRSRRA